MKNLKKELLTRTLAYGEACACARAAGTRLPSPKKIISALCSKCGFSELDEPVMELKDALVEFGQGVYYFSGELSASPSKVFLIGILQQTEFYDVAEYIADVAGRKVSSKVSSPYEIEYEEDYGLGLCIKQIADQIGQFGSIRLSA